MFVRLTLWGQSEDMPLFSLLLARLTVLNHAIGSTTVNRATAIIVGNLARRLMRNKLVHLQLRALM